VDTFKISWPTAAIIIAGIAAVVTAAALGVSKELVVIISALATLVSGAAHALVKKTPDERTSTPDIRDSIERGALSADEMKQLLADARTRAAHNADPATRHGRVSIPSHDPNDDDNS